MTVAGLSCLYAEHSCDFPSPFRENFRTIMRAQSDLYTVVIVVKGVVCIVLNNGIVSIARPLSVWAVYL